jgi:hypothetical protein
VENEALKKKSSEWLEFEEALCVDDEIRMNTLSLVLLKRQVWRLGLR